MESTLCMPEPESVASVTGSGSRVLAFLDRGAKKVTCIDLVQEQLWLAELRFETFRRLAHPDALAFWGLPPEGEDPKRRRALFEKLSLSQSCRSFFRDLFINNDWGSLSYQGRWERTFQKLSRIVQAVMGKSTFELFECKTLEEQNEFLRSHFPRWRWNFVLRAVGNSAFFNALLYQGAFPKKNIPESHFKFYASAYDRLFALGPVRENFFMHLSFFGKILNANGLPYEWGVETYARIQSALQRAEISFSCGELVETLSARSESWDLVSLSDVPSYFSHPLESQYLQLIKKSLRPKARVILRSYLHVPEGTEMRGYRDITHQFEQAIQRERVQMYRVQVFERETE